MARGKAKPKVETVTGTPCKHCGNVPHTDAKSQFCMECGSLLDDPIKKDAPQEYVSLGKPSDPPVFTKYHCIVCGDLPAQCRCEDDEYTNWVRLERDSTLEIGEPYNTKLPEGQQCKSCKFHWTYRCWPLRMYVKEIVTKNQAYPPTIDICKDYQPED